MFMPSWARGSVNRIRANVKTVRGTEVPDWDDVDTKAVTRCSMQPGGTDSDVDGRVNGVEVDYTLYAPMDADIISGDRVQFNGMTFEVIGKPKEWTGAYQLGHKIVSLKRYTG